MKTFHPSLLQLARVATLAFTVSGSGLALAQTATFDTDCVPQLSGMQQRLFDKADEGPNALRDFMFVRRGILQLDIYDTGVWADSIRQGRAACMKQLARTRGVPDATRMANAAARAPETR